MADPLIGATVGSFRIQKLLGRGGMGSVYLAEHPVIASRVAVKFLHESLASNPELVGRFYDEARAVNLIGHENIVSISDLALLPPNRYYIVMEYLEGATLASLLRRGAVDEGVALEVLFQLTGALHAAHERGIIHRDLKPENVFLVRRQGSDRFVKLVDFGIAKLGDRAGGAHTAAGMLVGTPEYMAPEQCDNRPIDARTDVYALGVMAYEIATGRLPFGGRGIAQVLLAQLKQKPVPPREIRPSVHPEFEKTILRALEKQPEHRFPDMRAFGEALRTVREAIRKEPAPPAPGAVTPVPGPISISTPIPTPITRPVLPPVQVEILLGGASRSLPVAEVSKGGLFLAADYDLPPLFAKVAVLLPADGDRVLPVAGEVVRHVSPAQAESWGMAPGFAVQLASLGPEEKAAAAALADRLRSPSARPAHRTVGGVGAVQLLESLERRALQGHYELLDARPEAGLPEIRERARGLRRQLEDLRAELPPRDQIGRVAALLDRIEQAALVLGTPAERLLFDARRGNFRGVAHCVVAGVAPALVEARRRAFLAERPGQESEAQRRVARSQVARKLGNSDAALAEMKAALQADPLNLELHREHDELEKAALARAP